MPKVPPHSLPPSARRRHKALTCRKNLDLSFSSTRMQGRERNWRLGTSMGSRSGRRSHVLVLAWRCRSGDRTGLWRGVFRWGRLCCRRVRMVKRTDSLPSKAFLVLNTTQRTRQLLAIVNLSYHSRSLSHRHVRNQTGSRCRSMRWSSRTSRRRSSSCQRCYLGRY